MVGRYIRSSVRQQQPTPRSSTNGKKSLAVPVRYIQIPIETAQQGMVNAGMPVCFAEDLIKIMKTWLEGRGSLVTPDVEDKTGRNPLALREFFENHRDLFIVKADKAA